MRKTIALAMSLGLLTGCQGDKGGTTTDTATAISTPAQPTDQPATAEPTRLPVTGQTHEVKMVQSASGAYEFEPKEITVKTGDGIRFVLVSGMPHNVAFDPADVPAAVQPQLKANMEDPNLQTPFMTSPGDSFVLSLGGIPPGTYPYQCTPHVNMNMFGTIIVQ